MARVVLPPLKSRLKLLNDWVLRKFEATAGSSAISPAVVDNTISVGSRCFPSATAFGNSQIGFWSWIMFGTKSFQETCLSGAGGAFGRGADCAISRTIALHKNMHNFPA